MAVRVDRDKSFYYPTGITVTPSFFCIKVIRKCKRLYINLYERNVEEAVEKIEYALEDEKGLFADEYGKSFSGKDSFGKVSLIDNPRRSPVYIAAFEWGDDLENVKAIEDKSLDSSFIYRLHARGFTKSNTSRIVDKGTFKGILEKVDYLKEIGADFIDIMPATEFDEFIRSAGSFFSLFDKEKKETQHKRNDIIRNLPAFGTKLELFLNCGMVYEDAMSKVIDGYSKEFPNELSKLISDAKELALISGRDEMEILGEKSRSLKIKELTRITAMIADSKYKGTELGEKLSREGEYLWQRRIKTAEENAKLAELKLSLPLALQLLSLIIITAAPAVIQF